MDLREEVGSYLEYCEFRKELDEKTLKAYTSIKAFYNYLVEEEIIYESPFRRIKVKFRETVVLPRIIPRDEIESLLNVIYTNRERVDRGKDKFWLRDIAVIETLFATGARVYEISNIRIDSVDLSSGHIRIMGKGNKERYIQIGNTSVLELLRRYYETNELAIKESGYFFVNRRGNRFSEQSIRIMIKKYAALAGIERSVTPHMFRHSFATYLIEEGVDISCVQQILGHSSIKTTQIYIHVAAKKQAEILRSSHPRNQMNIISAA